MGRISMDPQSSADAQRWVDDGATGAAVGRSRKKALGYMQVSSRDARWCLAHGATVRRYRVIADCTALRDGVERAGALINL